ncbi:MAG TPA: YceI family protein [Candidatus Polarisedimenticolaceae bacterium]|nr:YceI family protein [Candidatus Polarisedimenticolaceae bacterium]
MPATLLLAVALALSPKDTKVTFTLDATAHTVHGTVPLTSGTIHFDPASGRASGEIVLDLARAQTGNQGRDEDMHAKVLESGRYPRAVFRLQRIQGTLRPTGTSEIVLQGTLLFHGAEHPLEIPARVTTTGNHVRADGHLTIPYVAWGLRDPSKFVLRVGKSVEVRVEVEGDLR